MVSQEAVVFLALSGAIAFLLPIGLIVWFKRKYGASLKVFSYLLALSRFLSSLSCWKAAFMFMYCK